ncbi:conserved hypothetical protein [Alteromonas macleodii]|nr:hypothetical protein BFV93_4573 [Alteromonas macleodii]
MGDIMSGIVIMNKELTTNNTLEAERCGARERKYIFSNFHLTPP